MRCPERAEGPSLAPTCSLIGYEPFENTTSCVPGSMWGRHQAIWHTCSRISLTLLGRVLDFWGRLEVWMWGLELGVWGSGPPDQSPPRRPRATLL